VRTLTRPRARELGHGGVRDREPRAEQSEIGGSEREWRGWGGARHPR
jgi:hypothetical protein